MELSELFKQLQHIADDKFDGHYTILHFSTNVRVGFGTPSDRLDFDEVPAMPDLRSALRYAIDKEPNFYFLKEKI